MNWNTPDHSFCETRILGKPEFINAFSSICYIFVGIYHISRHINDIGFKLLSHLCIFIGVGSFFFHWTSFFGWRLMDEIPMILMEFFILFYIEDLLLKVDRMNNIEMIEYLELGNRRPVTRENFVFLWRGSNKILNIKMFFYTMGMITFTIFDVLPNEQHLFPYLYGSIFGINIYKLLRFRKEIEDIPETSTIRKNIKYSIISIILSIVVWASTEITCKFVQSYIFLLGHPLWHILSCYGLFLILLVLYDSKYIII